MVVIKSQDINAKILQKITAIEQTLSQRLTHIEAKLTAGQDTFFLINEGLQSYTRRCLRDSHISATNSSMHKFYENIRNDRDLRYPHRKILEFLLGQYDFEKNQFKEVHFSLLVREVRVGKNMAGSYLRLLEEKGYIEVRSDGYRKWVRVRG